MTNYKIQILVETPPKGFINFGNGEKEGIEFSLDSSFNAKYLKEKIKDVIDIEIRKLEKLGK